MDVVSEMISGIRAGAANARRIRETGPWGMRFPAFVGMGFHLVVHGDGWLIRPSGPALAVRPGDVVLVPGGAEHGLSHDPGVPLAELVVPAFGAVPPRPGPADFEFLCGAYRLEHGRVPPFLRRMPGAVVIAAEAGPRPELRALTDLLGEDVAADRPGTTATRAALVDLLLVHSLRRWQEREWLVVSDPGVASALGELHRSPQQPWTVQRLAEVAGMSRTVFSRRFTALIGQPPMAYLIDWRLRNGARLLRESSAPLAAIAREVGYANEFAFAGAFRREYGIAPGRFRRRN